MNIVKNVLKFVVWVIVIFLISFLYLLFAQYENWLPFATPIVSTLVFQRTIYYFKHLSFSNWITRITIMVSPLLIALSVFILKMIQSSYFFNHVTRFYNDWIKIILYLAIYYLSVSIIGDQIRIRIEAKNNH